MLPNPQLRLSAEQLAEQYLDGCRHGQRPDLDAYTLQFPEQADEIREIVSALMLLDSGEPEQPAPEKASEPEFGQFGRYQIIGEIGRGTMAVVYDAVCDPLGRVALKVLPRERAAQRAYSVRFEREARFLARLQHSGIAKLIEFGELDGLPFQAMEFVAGRSVDDVISELRRRRKSPGAKAQHDDDLLHEICAAMTGDDAGDGGHHYFRRIAEVGRQVADALAHAHDQRVLHCDIKPANILLDAAGSAWLTDFGLARDISEANAAKVEGTPRYMAPERFQGRTDVRSDVYALGITLYEMLTLQPAFLVLEKSLLIRQIQQVQPPPPSQFEPATPPDLEKVILKAMSKHAERRYASARELADALGSVS